MSSTPEELFNQLKLTQWNIINTGIPTYSSTSTEELSGLNSRFKIIADEFSTKMDISTNNFAGIFHGGLEVCQVTQNDQIIFDGNLGIKTLMYDVESSGYGGLKELNVCGGESVLTGATLKLVNTNNEELKNLISAIDSGNEVYNPVTIASIDFTKYNKTISNIIDTQATLEIQLGYNTKLSQILFNDQPFHIGNCQVYELSEAYDTIKSTYYGREYNETKYPGAYTEINHHFSQTINIGQNDIYNKDFSLVIPALQFEKTGHIFNVEDTKYNITLPTPIATHSSSITGGKLGLVTIGRHLSVDTTGLVEVNASSLIEDDFLVDKFAIKKAENTFTENNMFSKNIIVSHGGTILEDVGIDIGVKKVNTAYSTTNNIIVSKGGIGLEDVAIGVGLTMSSKTEDGTSSIVYSKSNDITVYKGGISLTDAGIKLTSTGHIDVSKGGIYLEKAGIDLSYSGNIIVSKGGISLKDAGIDLCSDGFVELVKGDLMLSQGSINLAYAGISISSTGNLTMNKGNINLTTGNMSVWSGGISFDNAGIGVGLTITSKEETGGTSIIYTKSNDITVYKGGISLTSAGINLSSTGNITVSKGGVALTTAGINLLSTGNITMTKGSLKITNSNVNTTLSTYNGGFKINTTSGSVSKELIGGFNNNYLTWGGNTIPVYKYGTAAPSGTSIEGMLYFQTVN